MAHVNVVSLETQALRAVPNEVMVKFMSDVWQSPLRLQYWDEFKSRLSLADMSRLAKTLPWDDPAARDLDFTVHKRRMHGKFFCFWVFPLPLHPFDYYSFSELNHPHGRIAILFSLFTDYAWSVKTFVEFEWWTRPLN